MSYAYSRDFLRYGAQSSAYAAHKIASSLAPVLAVASVLDVGCGLGTWLRAWSECGIKDFSGVDGDYVARDSLVIANDRFIATDLNRGFDLGRQFDLVQSLEVAEHIRPEASAAFIETLCRHARRYILFSAAPPGQGGEHHINEQTYEFWRGLLAKRDFVACDIVRPMIAADAKISFWYRYNTFLYVRREMLAASAPAVRERVVPAIESLADISPPLFRIRKAIVRRLPDMVQDGLARFKSRFVPTGRF